MCALFFCDNLREKQIYIYIYIYIYMKNGGEDLCFGKLGGSRNLRVTKGKEKESAYD
jgi:hypothetical protein